MSDPQAYAKARQLIDDAHKQDPLYVKRQKQSSSNSNSTSSIPQQEGGNYVDSKDEEEVKQDELEYADAMEKWTISLIDRATSSSRGPEHDVISSIKGGRDILVLAARCQHLERFKTPRSSYPEGKASYLKWRRDLYTIQANRAMDLLEQAGISEEECTNVGTWVSKKDLKPGKPGGIWGTQLLEDAAVLVFLQDQLLQFATQHSTYTREKFVDILRKTWRKLSDDGKEAAKGLEMPDGLKGIIAEATQGTAGSEGAEEKKEEEGDK